MAKDRNIPKKTRSRKYEPWCGECERFGDHRRRMAAEYEVNPPHLSYRRKKKKNVLLMMHPTGDTKRQWWVRPGWRVFGRYEKMKDAVNALKAVKKSWWVQYYTFRIEDRRNGVSSNG